MEYIIAIFGFITGGGITALVSFKYQKKTSKLDYADRAMKFMEDTNNKLINRVDELEGRITKLEGISCKRMDCTLRIID